MRRVSLECCAIIATVLSASSQPKDTVLTGRHEVFLLRRLDDPSTFVSDSVEARIQTSPASTFKVPHSLIALETGVVTNSWQLVRWDGSKQSFGTWERDHSLVSAVRSSVVWFFKRTASLIGVEKMKRSLERIGYAEDTFDGDVTSFWLNGDLVVSPMEQISFLTRLAQKDLMARPEHIDSVLAAMEMPDGKITNAAGTLEFRPQLPGPLRVRAKTGFTTVDGESVSWLVGYVQTGKTTYVFVSRVRDTGPLSGLSATELALKRLNALAPALEEGR